MTDETLQQQCNQIITHLYSLANPELAASHARFGIRSANMLGIRMPDLHQIARGRRDHRLALALWETGIYDARVVASLIDDPCQVSLDQMETWVLDFDSWGICDQVCMTLFVRTPYAMQYALAWCHRPPEYIRRAGFVLMAMLPIHAKKLPDEVYFPFFPLMLQYASDERLYVRKAINWALRQIGKRRPGLYNLAIETAHQMGQIDSPAARWIASDALRELKTVRRKNDPHE
jgi:3-methyladenine DNA glycosylase AlkD